MLYKKIVPALALCALLNATLHPADAAVDNHCAPSAHNPTTVVHPQSTRLAESIIVKQAAPAIAPRLSTSIKNYLQGLFNHQREADVHSPSTIKDLICIVRKAHAENKKIAIVGKGKSQGGQTMSAEPSYQISLKKFNKLLRLDVQKKEITVQAGMTWGQLQQAIAPYSLAVKAMQSYNDFSIGGSLGVNVHGQDLVENPLIKTVKSFKLLKADGSLITVSRSQNKDLFSLAIGGYGLFGIITEVTFSLVSDSSLAVKNQTIPADALANYFTTTVKNDSSIEFYSARFSLDPENPLEKASVITYQKNGTQPEPTVLQPKSRKTMLANWALRNTLWLTKRFPFLKRLRFKLEQYLFNNSITSRNNFMSYSIKSLPQDSDSTHYILQEYFIPYEHMQTFINDLRSIIKEHNINMLNITARHVCKDTESFLSFSPQDSCAFVLYLPVAKHNAQDYAHTVQWTQQLIDKALACNGTYYLPYQLIASKEQLLQAYPQFDTFIALKKQHDPQELFTNKFYEKYK